MTVRDNNVQRLRGNSGGLQHQLGEQPVLGSKCLFGPKEQTCQTSIVQLAVLVRRAIAVHDAVFRVKPCHGYVKPPTKVLQNEIKKNLDIGAKKKFNKLFLKLRHLHL